MLEKLTPVYSVRDVKRRLGHLAPFHSLCVGSIVPTVFERYARIFHPAWLVYPERRTALSWAEMANWSGSKPHPLMQWDYISAPTMRDAVVEPPDTGALPLAVSKPLHDILASHCKRGACWLGVWKGWGWDYRKHVPKTRFVDTGARDWDLFRAPLCMMDMPFFVGEDKTANLIWCDDPSWWITTDIDLNTSYIGGDKKLIQEVLGSPTLEALPVTVDDGITTCSDRVNSVGNSEDEPNP